MKGMAIKVLILAVGGAVLSGCASMPTRIGVQSGKNYDIIGKGEGSAGGFMLLQFIPIAHNSKLQRAYDEAVQSRGGDDLINLVLKESWYWAYIGDGYRVHIEGDVIKYKK